MPINGYFDTKFAQNGDLNTIPDATQPSGTVSYNQGFPILYSTPVGSGGYNVPRTAINQVLNDITTAIQAYQQFGTPAFITSTMNGGTPYSYNQYARVLLSGVVYQSLVGTNTDTPPSSKWAVADLSSNNIFTAGTTTGSANAQVIASVSPSGGPFTNGQSIVCTAGFTNTNTATFTAPGESALAINKNSGTGLVALAAGDIIAGDTLFLVKNIASSCWVLEAGLPIGTAAYKSVATFLQTANNLSDLASVVTALTNLGFSATYSTQQDIHIFGFIIKMGVVASLAPAASTSPTFTTGFPTACFGVFAMPTAGGTTGGASMAVTTSSTSGFTLLNNINATNTNIPWVAFGH